MVKAGFAPLWFFSSILHWSDSELKVLWKRGLPVACSVTFVLEALFTELLYHRTCSCSYCNKPNGLNTLILLSQWATKLTSLYYCQCLLIGTSQSNVRFLHFISCSCVHPAVTQRVSLSVCVCRSRRVLTTYVSVIYKAQNHKFVSEGFYRRHFQPVRKELAAFYSLF